jgi:hypothetical protein|tara:strand:- start:162 stop:488 length:327 start_codon:yes stop_codon:yes gene_type:complete
MYCAKCGESQENNNYCFSCGNKLDSFLELESNPVTTANKILKDKTKELRSGSTGWIIFAFISAILGGPVGIAMGAHYAWWGKNYDKNTKTLGYIMMIVGSISLMIVSN